MDHKIYSRIHRTQYLCSDHRNCSARHDIFLATRLAFNDVDDTSVLAGVSIDTRTRETFFNIEAERRFSDNLSGSLRLRAFTNAAPGDLLYSIQRDDYVQLRLSWYY